MALLNVIKCEAPPSVLAWRHPQNAILYGSQLIVSETQYAYMMKEGRMIGPFGPGTHFLETKKLPNFKEFNWLSYWGGVTIFGRSMVCKPEHRPGFALGNCHTHPSEGPFI